MQLFKTLNDDPEKFRKAEEAAGERPVPVNRTWRYANSNFGMGL